MGAVPAPTGKADDAYELRVLWASEWPLPVGANARRRWFIWRYGLEGDFEEADLYARDPQPHVDLLASSRLELLNLVISPQFLENLAAGVDRPLLGFGTDEWLGLALRDGAAGAWLLGMLAPAPRAVRPLWRFAYCRLTRSDGSTEALRDWFNRAILRPNLGGRPTASLEEKLKMFEQQQIIVRKLVEREWVGLNGITYARVAGELGVHPKTLYNWSRDPDSPVLPPKELALKLFPEFRLHKIRQ